MTPSPLLSWTHLNKLLELSSHLQTEVQCHPQDCLWGFTMLKYLKRLTYWLALLSKGSYFWWQLSFVFDAPFLVPPYSLSRTIQLSVSTALIPWLLPGVGCFFTISYTMVRMSCGHSKPFDAALIIAKHLCTTNWIWFNLCKSPHNSTSKTFIYNGKDKQNTDSRE
jgi:hypothetical protein